MSRFAIIPAYCLSDDRLSARDITVLCSLGIHTDKNGFCHPALSTLAEILGISRQAVQKSMRKLIECGYLQSNSRLRKNGSQTSNQYRILFDDGCDKNHQRIDPPLQPQVAPPATSEVAPPATSEVAPYRTSQLNAPSEVSPPNPPKGGTTTFRIYLQNCKATGQKAIPEDDAVFTYATEAGIPLEFLRLCWEEFRDEYVERDVRQKSWPQKFRNYVKRNYYKLWYVAADGSYQLTTAGKQADNRNKNRAA